MSTTAIGYETADDLRFVTLARPIMLQDLIIMTENSY